MRKQLERKANMIFALAAVAVLAVLLLSDMSLWKILVPVWFGSWLVAQIALQHYATHQETIGYDRDSFGVSYVSELFRAINIDDKLNDNYNLSKAKAEIDRFAE